MKKVMELLVVAPAVVLIGATVGGWVIIGISKTGIWT